MLPRPLLVASLALILVGLSAIPASSAADTEPPAFTVQPYMTVKLGQSLNSSFVDPDTGYWQCPGARTTLRWRATDPSGVEEYWAYRFTWSDPYDGSNGYERTEIYNGTRPQVSFWLAPHDNGSFHFRDLGWFIGALDGALNYGETHKPQQWIGCSDEDGDSHTLFDYGIDFARQLSGTWGVSSCACWMGGTTIRTFQEGATVSYTVSSSTAGDPGVGLVMPVGPDRGQAAVSVNGQRVAVVDTYSATRKHRKVMFFSRTVGAGDVITVKNLATPGHSRIDVDGLVYFW